MLEWFARWATWIIVRLVATGACIFTIQSALTSEGFRTDIRSLCIIAGCMILAIRLWSSNPDPKSISKGFSNDDV
jgi:hypothetical protein